VLQWGAMDRGLADALAGVGIDIKDAVPDAEEAFLGLLGELLRVAQKAGTVRRDVDVPDVKAIVVGTQAMQAYNPDTAARPSICATRGSRRSTRVPTVSRRRIWWGASWAWTAGWRSTGCSRMFMPRRRTPG
jgi:hypothetical protein